MKNVGINSMDSMDSIPLELEMSFCCLCQPTVRGGAVVLQYQLRNLITKEGDERKSEYFADSSAALSLCQTVWRGQGEGEDRGEDEPGLQLRRHS